MNLYPIGALSSLSGPPTGGVSDKTQPAEPISAAGDSTDRDADGRQDWDQFERSEPPLAQPDQTDANDPPPTTPDDEGHLDLLA